jgi:hypothetical protein
MVAASVKTRKPLLDEGTVSKHIKKIESHIQKELNECFKGMSATRQRQIKYLKSVQTVTPPLKQLLKQPPDLGFSESGEVSTQGYLATDLSGRLISGYELPFTTVPSLPALPDAYPSVMTVVRPPYLYGDPLVPITEFLQESQRMVLYSLCWPTTGGMELAATVTPVDAASTLSGQGRYRRAFARIIAQEYSVPPGHSQVTIRCSFNVLGESYIFAIGPGPAQGWASVNINLFLTILNYNQNESRTARGDIHSRLERAGDYHLDNQRISVTGDLAVTMPVLAGDRLMIALSAMLVVGTSIYPEGNLVALGDASHFCPIYEAPGPGVTVPFFRIS